METALAVGVAPVVTLTNPPLKSVLQKLPSGPLVLNCRFVPAEGGGMAAPSAVPSVLTFWVEPSVAFAIHSSPLMLAMPRGPFGVAAPGVIVGAALPLGLIWKTFLT